MRYETSTVATLCERGASVNTTVKNGDTFIHDAVLTVGASALESILSHGAKVKALNKDTKSPLDLIQLNFPLTQALFEDSPRLEFA